MVQYHGASQSSQTLVSSSSSSCSLVESDVEDSDSMSSQTSQQQFTLLPNSYEIVLCIDSRERISNDFSKDNRAAFASALQKQGVLVDVRTLPLGDFVWIARELDSPRCGDNPSQLSSMSNTIQRELVLDIIVERKRIDDLASSIKDKRWAEQKFRLKNCGLRKPTYLVEYMGRNSRQNEHGAIKPEALEQAMANAEIDGFCVHKTDSFEETIRYLTTMTRWIQSHYRNQVIKSCTDKDPIDKLPPSSHTYISFNQFTLNAGKIQVFTAREMFRKQLMQMRGLSIAKTNVIISQYPTFASLMSAYTSDCMDLFTKHNLFSDARCEDLISKSRRFGPVASKRVCEYYMAT